MIGDKCHLQQKGSSDSQSFVNKHLVIISLVIIQWTHWSSGVLQILMYLTLMFVLFPSQANKTFVTLLIKKLISLVIILLVFKHH